MARRVLFGAAMLAVVLLLPACAGFGGSGGSGAGGSGGAGGSEGPTGTASGSASPDG
jgi:hypothetical protein